MTRIAFLLSAMTFAPAAVALALAGWTSVMRRFGRDLPESMWRGVGLGTLLFSAMLALWLWTAFDPASTSQFQFVERVPWIPEWGLHYFVGVDGISLLLILLTTCLFPLVFIASWEMVTHHIRSWVALLLVLETSLIGMFSALNAVQFFVWLEVGMLPLAMLVSIWGGAGRARAASRVLACQALASAALFLAFMALHQLHMEQFGSATFDIAAPSANAIAWLDTVIPVASERWWATQNVLFAALVFAFGLQMGIAPLHLWATGVSREASLPATALIFAVVSKVGAYGVLRFALPLAPVAAVSFAEPLRWAAALALLFGALSALGQRGAVGFVAHASLAQIAWLWLGWFSLSASGLEGGVLYLLSHGLCVAGLLLLVGMLQHRTQTDAWADFGGIAKPMPIFVLLLGVIVLVSISAPGGMGFAGSFLVLLGLFGADFGVAAVTALGALVLAVGWGWNFRRLAFGPVENPANRGLIDLGWRERLTAVLLILPLVVVGVRPEIVNARLHHPVLKLRRAMLERAIDSHEASPHPAAEEAIERLQQVSRDASSPGSVAVVSSPEQPVREGVPR